MNESPLAGDAKTCTQQVLNTRKEIPLELIHSNKQENTQRPRAVPVSPVAALADRSAFISFKSPRNDKSWPRCKAIAAFRHRQAAPSALTGENAIKEKIVMDQTTERGNASFLKVPVTSQECHREEAVNGRASNSQVMVPRCRCCGKRPSAKLNETNRKLPEGKRCSVVLNATAARRRGKLLAQTIAVGSPPSLCGVCSAPRSPAGAVRNHQGACPRGVTPWLSHAQQQPAGCRSASP